MRIGILGYGNLGRAVEIMSIGREDIQIVGVFTRRDPEKIKTLGAPVYREGLAQRLASEIDCMLICHGSRDDLPVYTPLYSKLFNTVDTYDNHAKIKEHRAKVDESARQGGNVSIVSVGWDPGLLSLIRLYSSAFMHGCTLNTFWGRGVSQGHSEAIRRIDGVKLAVEYTVPRAEALSLAELSSVSLTDTERHKRICYIVADAGREEYISARIRNMEGYFKGYETEINFIDEDEFRTVHYKKPHRGRIIATLSTGIYKENRHRVYFDAELDSNPEFTSSILLSSAEAAFRMKKEGHTGAFTLYDIPPKYFVSAGDSDCYHML